MMIHLQEHLPLFSRRFRYFPHLLRALPTRRAVLYSGLAAFFLSPIFIAQAEIDETGNLVVGLIGGKGELSLSQILIAEINCRAGKAKPHIHAIAADHPAKIVLNAIEG
jgi:hypothetical protein